MTADMLKIADYFGIHWLYRIFKNIWKKKRVSKNWRKGFIIPLFNKRDIYNCNNYRNITLMSHTIKVFDRILEEKIRSKVGKLF